MKDVRMTMNDFTGSRIRKARKAMKLKQEELARLINVSDSTIGDWERGRTEPSIDCLLRLSNALHKPVAYLIEPAYVDQQVSSVAERGSNAAIVKAGRDGNVSMNATPDTIIAQGEETFAAMMRALWRRDHAAFWRHAKELVRNGTEREVSRETNGKGAKGQWK